MRGGDRLAASINAAGFVVLVDRGELVARGFEGLAGPDKQNPRPVAAERGCFSSLPLPRRARGVERRNAKGLNHAPRLPVKVMHFAPRVSHASPRVSRRRLNRADA